VSSHGRMIGRGPAIRVLRVIRVIRVIQVIQE
jgi:hypothetical protein